MSRFATPEELEKHHVRDVYDKIAPHFVGSRHKAWPRVEQFLLSLPAGSLIADVGKRVIWLIFNKSKKSEKRRLICTRYRLICVAEDLMIFTTKDCFSVILRYNRIMDYSWKHWSEKRKILMRHKLIKISYTLYLECTKDRFTFFKKFLPAAIKLYSVSADFNNIVIFCSKWFLSEALCDWVYAWLFKNIILSSFALRLCKCYSTCAFTS